MPAALSLISRCRQLFRGKREYVVRALTFLVSMFRKLLSNHVVAISEPYQDGDAWVYVFIADGWFERRVFEDRDEAVAHFWATKTGLSLGAVFISVTELPIEVAREMQDPPDAGRLAAAKKQKISKSFDWKLAWRA